MGLAGLGLAGLGPAGLGIAGLGTAGLGRQGAGRGGGYRSGRRGGRGSFCRGSIHRWSVCRGGRDAGCGLVVARLLIPCDSVIVSIRITNVIQFVRFNLLRRQFRLRLSRRLPSSRRRGPPGGTGRRRPPLTLAALRDVTGHMAPGRLAEPGCRDSTRAGLARPADRGRSHALTFHLCNVLLNTPTKPPAGLSGSVGACGAGAGPPG